MKLKAYRKLMDWTLREMAKKAGVSISYVAMMEKGERRPSPQVARRIYELSGGAITLEDQFFDN